VMPAGFKGITDQAELWVPFALYASPAGMAERGSRGFVALARLKAGKTIASAQSEMDAISKQLEQAYPATNEKRGVELSPLDVELFGALRPALFTLMAAVVFVLLIACANVANLLLARSEARQREIALRTALGAGWRRLLRQLVTEGCVLAALGALAGLVLANVAVQILLATSPVTLPSFVTPRIDPRVAMFTVLVSLVCGTILGLAPAVHARVSRLGEALKDSSRGSDGRRSQRVRSVLVVAEVSLAVVLLVGASLMIRSVRKLAALEPGFDPSSVLTLRVSIPRAAAAAPPAAGTPAAPPPLVVEMRSLVERIRTVAGVTAVGLGTDMPDNPPADPDFYLPYPYRNQQVSIAIRTSVPPASVVSAVRAAIRSADASIPIYQVSPMEESVSAQTAQSRFTMWLMGVFAACALMLAVVGIYGFMSYLVTQRTREIGIRLALGAGGSDILRLVVGNGARMIGAGIVIGVAGAFALQRLVSSLLFGVTAADPSSLFAVALLAVVALVACYLPALRATRVSPLSALRHVL